ncbi:DUF1513 domain-containing protein [Vibrio lentus]|nr:DUF1513 domain-containing protein [Vibrio lentus]
MHTKGGQFESLNVEPEQWARFNHYIASIAASDDLDYCDFAKRQLLRYLV